MKRSNSLTIVAMLAFGGVAAADKLSDFQDAVKNTGCESIPYSDYKSAA